MLAASRVDALRYGRRGETADDAMSRLALLRKAERARFLGGRVEGRGQIQDDETASLAERSVGGVGAGGLGTMQAPRSAYMDGRQYSEGLREEGELASLTSELSGKGPVRRQGGYPSSGNTGIAGPGIEALRRYAELGSQDRAGAPTGDPLYDSAAAQGSGRVQAVAGLRLQQVRSATNALRNADIENDPLNRRSAMMHDVPYFENQAADRELQQFEKAQPVRNRFALQDALSRARSIPIAQAQAFMSPDVQAMENNKAGRALDALRAHYTDPVIAKAELEQQLAQIHEEGRLKTAEATAAGRTGAAGIDNLRHYDAMRRAADPTADISRNEEIVRGQIPAGAPAPEPEFENPQQMADYLIQQHPQATAEQLVQFADENLEGMSSTDRTMLTMAIRARKIRPQ